MHNYSVAVECIVKRIFVVYELKYFRRKGAGDDGKARSVDGRMDRWMDVRRCARVYTFLFCVRDA